MITIKTLYNTEREFENAIQSVAEKEIPLIKLSNDEVCHEYIQKGNGLQLKICSQTPFENEPATIVKNEPLIITERKIIYFDKGNTRFTLNNLINYAVEIFIRETDKTIKSDKPKLTA